MKKLISLFLVLTMVFMICSVAAFAQEAPAASGLNNDGYIELDYTNEDGTPQYEVDPEGGAVFNVSDTIYNYNGTADTVAGAQFVVSTNTLVLTDFKASDRILRLGFFTDNVNIEINGSCEIGRIETYRAGLNITGAGSLVVNPKGLYEAAIELDADKAETTLSFGRDVSVAIYEGGDNPVCAVIRSNPGGTANAHITFSAEHNGTLSEHNNTCEQPVSAEGFIRREEEAKGNWLGDQMDSKSDPDGVYAGFEFTESGGSEGIVYQRFVYVESLGCYLPDLSFSDNIWEAVYGTSMYKDEFENSDYSFKTDEYGDHIPLTSPYMYEFHHRLAVGEDAHGSRYAAEEIYDPSTEKSDYVFYTYAPIDGMEGVYELTKAEGVDENDLTPVQDGEEILAVSGYTFSEPQNIIRFAKKVVSSSDPSGIYGCREMWFDEEPYMRECIIRYVYDEKRGYYFEDNRFAPIEVTGDTFTEGSEFQLVYDEFEEEEYLTYNGFFIEPCRGDVFEDQSGVRYAVNYQYNSTTGEWDKVIYALEPIEGLKDRYIFTLAQDVSFDSLSPCMEEVAIEDEVDFILSGSDGVFLYNGAAVSGFTLSGTVESFLPEQNNHAEIKVYRDGEETAVATKVLEGTVSSYRIIGLQAGSYTVKVDKAYHVAREYTVTISDDTTLDMKICPIGDANLSGTVTSSDANVIYKQVLGTKKITDPYALLCADADSRNSVTSSDANAIYKHVLGTKKLF